MVRRRITANENRMTTLQETVLNESLPMGVFLLVNDLPLQKKTNLKDLGLHLTEYLQKSYCMLTLSSLYPYPVIRILQNRYILVDDVVIAEFTPLSVKIAASRDKDIEEKVKAVIKKVAKAQLQLSAEIVDFITIRINFDFSSYQNLVQASGKPLILKGLLFN